MNALSYPTGNSPTGPHESEEEKKTHLFELQKIVDERTWELRQLSNRLLTLQDDERRKIARDLHDSTGQKIVGLLLDLSIIARKQHELDPVALNALKESFSLATQISEEIRTLSYLMHPPFLDDFGLASAISCYVEGLNKRKGLRVIFTEANTIGRLAEQVEIGLFRIMQAALTNVYLHSGSHTATVRLDQDGENITMEVIDEGHGIKDAGLSQGSQIAAPGIGLTGIKERLALIDGRMEIESNEYGTTIRAIVPFAPRGGIEVGFRSRNL